MDLKSNHASPVLADPVPIKQSRLSLYSNMFPYTPSRAALSPDLLLIPRKKTGIRDDVLSSGWLDAMKASSPPPKRIAKDVNDEFPSSDSDLLYCNWMIHNMLRLPTRSSLMTLHSVFCLSEPSTDRMRSPSMEVKYPSALASFEQIVAHAKGKRIALFLDYDGTLSPIVDNPDCAFMSNAMRAAVKEVAKCFPTAIISGRSRDKVYEFVGLPELHYAGSHGMDIMGPERKSNFGKHRYSSRGRLNNQEKEVKLFQPASEFLPLIDEVFKSLGECTKAIDGAKVENNKFCVSVHYRNVDEKNWDVIAQCVHDVLKDYPQLRLTHGRKVLEVRPVISWDKGKAVTFLLESLGLDNCDDVLPIYVGDDRTDEDAFKVLRDGNCGYGILVSSMPKESNAVYSLRDPSEVMEFLNSLAKWKKAGTL